MEAFQFPHGFLLGVATAATQIDGNCRESNWYDWYCKGHIRDGSSPDTATLHRQHMREDTELMASMGIRHYRFGLEWARLEPHEGEFCQEEFKLIREELLLLREHGIKVLLTIHHFSNPMWFENAGGFSQPGCVAAFLRLTKKVVEELGDLVCEYITINEPNVYAVNGYLGGGFPPGKNSMPTALRVMRNMGRCHRGAYRLIHQLREEKGYRDTKVSFAHHMRAFAPMNAKNPWHRLCCRISEYLFQGNISRTYLLGTAGERGQYADFLAVNYYTRTASAGFSDGVFSGVPKNDLGWEIYPRGITLCCQKLHKLLPELPIYITENGTADASDAFRRRFLCEHLRELSESGLPVARYYHWCFVDNWEWLEGFSARFGLVEYDTDTQDRRMKKSGEFYQAMIRQGGVTAEMAAEIAGEEYKYE